MTVLLPPTDWFEKFETLQKILNYVLYFFIAVCIFLIWQLNRQGTHLEEVCAGVQAAEEELLPLYMGENLLKTAPELDSAIKALNRARQSCTN